MKYKLLISHKLKKEDEKILMLEKHLKDNEDDIFEIENALEYEGIKLTTYAAILLEEKNEEYFEKNIICIIPFIESRNSYISQQLIPLYNEYVNKSLLTYEFDLMRKKILVANFHEKSLATSQLINIKCVLTLNLDFVDFTKNEQIKEVKKYQNLEEFDQEIKQISENKNDFFEIDTLNKKISFKTIRLKDGIKITNEPYYFLIKSYCALELAIKDGYHIDLYEFEYNIFHGNKSLDIFYRYILKYKYHNYLLGKYAIPLNKTINKKRDLPYQKIVYGAPGTGKSYGLANQIKIEFPNFVNPINEFNISENNEKIWLVGATWEGINKYSEFIKDNKWINGYDSGSDFQRAEKMSKDDYIIMKTAYFTGEGNKIPTLEIKAIGKIKKIKVSGKEVEVEWLIKDLSKKIIGENFRGTIHDISQKKDLINKIFDNTEIFTKKTEEIKASQRVTFYDGYTYGQFVGAYKPVMYEKDSEEKEIRYEFVAGPLLKQVLNAYKYPEKDFVLVIEEINRAKADRIFGDVFQLLDRNSEGDSEYPILLSQEQENYFKENLDGERYLETIAKKEGLYLPNNLYIWATMNSADQGVYPMDTAFKRRWDFEYIPLNKNKREEEFFIEIYKEKYSWNDYRETLNDILGEQGVTEDRLISPYFLKETDFDENKILKKSSYINKFLMYVFDDILKHNNRLKEALFTEKNFYKIFEKIGNEQIYSINFLDRLNERTKKVDDEITEE